jgi:hypothetical protein
VTAGDEIRNLLGLYCERIDAGNFAAVGALFAEGALLGPDGHELARGAEAVASFYDRGTRLHDGSPRTKHLVTNVVLDLDEDAGTASARSSYLVLQQVDGSPLAPVITGRYEDSFARTRGAWHFVERRFHVDLVGDLSRHLAYSIG